LGVVKKMLTDDGFVKLPGTGVLTRAGKALTDVWSGRIGNRFWDVLFDSLFQALRRATNVLTTLEKDGTNKADRTYLTSRKVLSSFVSCYVDQSFTAKFVQAGVLVRTHRQSESEEYHPWIYSPMNLWIISV